MRSRTVLVDCPACGEDLAIEVRYSLEYQGTGAWAGTVEALDEVVELCRCRLTSEQERVAVEMAESDQGQELAFEPWELD